MEHSEKYETIRRYYREGLWSIERVRNAVVKRWITPEEYQEITGRIYDPNGYSAQNSSELEGRVNDLEAQLEAAKILLGVE